MKQLSQLLSLSIIALLPFLSMADDRLQDVNGEDSHLTAKFSTMGLGLEYNHPVNSVLSLGFAVNKYNHRLKGTSGSVNSNADLKLESFSIIANYHPWKNGFRLRTGAYYNNNAIKFGASGNAKLNNITYNAVVNGKVDFDKFAPYFGIGYGSEPKGDNRLSIDFDIGVMKSSPSLDLKVVSCNVGGADCTGINTNLQAEKNKLNKDFDKFKVYPVISLGLIYRF